MCLCNSNVVAWFVEVVSKTSNHELLEKEISFIEFSSNFKIPCNIKNNRKIETDMVKVGKRL